MTRTNARELTVQFCFALSFQDISVETFLARHLNRDTFALLAPEDPLCAEFPDDNQLTYISKLVTGVSQHAPELDGYIARYSVGWNFSRISRLAAAIMRVAMYEILYMPDIPNSAAINEAVEIAKGYEEPQVVSFINGILGSFVRAEFPEEKAQKPDLPEEDQK
jgi:N utilization substance protein B